MFDSYKLLLASAILTRPKYRSISLALLRPFIKGGQIYFRYRGYDKTMAASLRLSDLDSDVRSIWELCVADTYGVDIAFAPDLVIDGGGNIGLFTLRMASMPPSQEVAGRKLVIVEPLPRNIEQIKNHLQLNSLKAVIMPVCLGGTSRTIPFFCREAIRSSFDPKEPYTSVIDLPVLTLEEIIKQFPAERILIKLDIEGMELETLRSFVPTERRAIYILGELHDYAGQSSEMSSLFRSHGWKIDYYEINDGYANFRACSPAALPLIPSFAA